MKRIIWSNALDLSAEGLESIRTQFQEVREKSDEEMKDTPVSELIEFASDEASRWLCDETANLNVPLDHPILVVADLGLWDGHHQGYRVLGSNVSCIFRIMQGAVVTYYADAYNVYADDAHHDGENHYMFRVLRGDADACMPLLNAIYSGEPVSKATMNRYSRSLLPYVADVYGWPVAGRKKKGCGKT